MRRLLQRIRRTWTDVARAKEAFLFGFFVVRSETRAERFSDELWRARGRGFRTGLMSALGLDSSQARSERLQQRDVSYAPVGVHPRDEHVLKTCPSCGDSSFCDACNLCIICQFVPPCMSKGYGCAECGGIEYEGEPYHLRTCSVTLQAAAEEAR